MLATLPASRRRWRAGFPCSLRLRTTPSPCRASTCTRTLREIGFVLCCQVGCWMNQGWPEQSCDHDSGLRSFPSRDSRSTEIGCIFKAQNMLDHFQLLKKSNRSWKNVKFNIWYWSSIVQFCDYSETGLRLWVRPSGIGKSVTKTDCHSIRRFAI